MARQRIVTVKATEYKFEPSVIEVEQGSRVRIRLENAGTEPHEFELNAFNFELGPIEPGKTAEGSFVADRVGVYEFACHVDQHYDKGMMGFLKVKE